MSAPHISDYGIAPVEPDEEVWLRDLDGTGSMHVCTPHCPGAIKYVREDLISDCPDVVREKVL